MTCTIYILTPDQLEDIIEKNKFEWENIARSKSVLTKYGKIIFVRDMCKQWYINGINQKIDSVEKVIEFLRTETENMRVTTVGNSSGGYMATLVAQKLNAKMAYCISGQFDIADQINRQPVVRKAAKENYKYINIVKTITSTTVIYLYPALCEWDKQQAGLVNNNNFVISIPFSNSKHGETCYGFNFPYILTCDKQIFEHLMKNAPMGGYSKRIFLFRTCLLYTSFTEEQLRSVGINNVINTGCPTMWGMTSKKCSKVPSRKGKDVIFTLTDYKPDRKRDQYLIDVLRKEYEDIYFWVQGSRDYEYLRTLNNIESIKIVSPSLQGYDSFLENTKNIDYVGTRLHGGMRALQHEKRTIILGIDNRAIELNKDYNIPVIEQKNLSDLHNLINDTWGTEIKLPMEAIKKFLGQFGITYVSE